MFSTTASKSGRTKSGGRDDDDGVDTSESEGAGAVVEGSFGGDGVFRATQVIAKHDEVYQAPSPGATPSHRTTAP